MCTILKNALLAFTLAIALGAPGSAAAQAPAAGPSVLPTGGGQALLDTSDSVLLLLDHQAGLFQTVKDVPLIDLRANVVMLAKLATLLKIPVITTASEPNGPNGPLMPEIHQFAPAAVYVGRKGEVNAWDNEDFVKAVRATGKKTLIMAGVWTSVCVTFPAIPARWLHARRWPASFRPASSQPRPMRSCPRRIAPGTGPKRANSQSSMPWRLPTTRL